ncbi:MAG: GNAT family N-acetyltransferase [Chloroflexota bacterium]|nr:GNAT family N-acetyltransferase [Chloroflexota bacterium]
MRLRAIEPADWPACHAWDRDDDQARNLAAVLFPRSEESARRWAEAESRRQPEDHHFRFVIENKTGEVVGDLTTHHCDARVGTFAYGISIRHDQRGKGYAKEAIRLVLHYYFR